MYEIYLRALLFVGILVNQYDRRDYDPTSVLALKINGKEISRSARGTYDDFGAKDPMSLVA